ncbi:hypothetical protein ACQKFM_29225 [Paenibacillus xylanexedens]
MELTIEDLKLIHVQLIQIDGRLNSDIKSLQDATHQFERVVLAPKEGAEQ